MANNPLTFYDIQNFFQGSFQNGINPPHIPQGYVIASPAVGDGAILPRLFDAAYISTGIIDPNRLGTGAVGNGNLYLADDGTWKAVSGSGGPLTNSNVLIDGGTFTAPNNALIDAGGFI
jgi:hypothetical protein